MSAARGGSQWGEKKREAYWSRSGSLFQRWMYSCRVLAFSVPLNNYLLFTPPHPGHLLSLGHMPSTSTSILSACCFPVCFFQLQQLPNQDSQWLTTQPRGLSWAVTCDVTLPSALPRVPEGGHGKLVWASSVSVSVLVYSTSQLKYPMVSRVMLSGHRQGFFLHPIPPEEAQVCRQRG